MALSITELIDELETLTKWQETPYPLLEEDYLNMIVRGIKRLFADTNRPAAFDKSLFKEVENEEENQEEAVEPTSEETEEEHNQVTKELIYDMELNIIEERYILICSEIEFFKRVQTDVNDKFSYSTDALKVTNADKPYANLKDSISELEKERRILYYKMVDYTLGNGT